MSKPVLAVCGILALGSIARGSDCGLCASAVATFAPAPTIRYEQVTVDEGSYRTVWVPKLVTRTVARRECENRVVWNAPAAPCPVVRATPAFGCAPIAATAATLPTLAKPREIEVVLERPVPLPTPDPGFSANAYEEWTPIPSRSASRLGDDRRDAANAPASTISATRRTPVRGASIKLGSPPSRGRSGAIPTAAAVWNYRNDTQRN